MPLADHIPENLHHQNKLNETLVHLQQSKYSFRLREAAYLDWCDKTDNTPNYNEVQSLKIGLS